MSAGITKDWAEAHWAPLTGENTELTQFNIWHHRRFGFVDHRDSACGNRWLAWQASREAMVVDLPEFWDCGAGGLVIGKDELIPALEAAGLKVKP